MRSRFSTASSKFGFGRAWITFLLALSLLVPFTAVLHAAVAHVQTTRTIDADFDSTVTTGSITLTAGNLLVAVLECVASPNACEWAGSIKLDGTTDFTRGDRIWSTVIETSEQWYLANTPSGSHTATMTFDGGAGDPGYVVLYLTEVSGAATTSPLDSTCVSQAQVGTTTPSSGSYTRNSTSFFIGNTNANAATAAPTAGSGWTIPTNGSTTNADVFSSALEYRTGQAAVTADFSVDTSINAATIGCAYLAAASSVKSRALLLGV